MVIENQIPKTETVYEIKDEYKVPSFEEFMKTYESDDNLNYEDLSGGDIGEVKGYGPCKNSHCGCDCSFDRCTCASFQGSNYDKNGFKFNSCEVSGRAGTEKGYAKASVEMNHSLFRIKDSSCDIKFLSRSVGGEVGPSPSGYGGKLRAGADVVNFKTEAFQARVGLNVDSGLTNEEAKLFGFGVSFGENKGISTPFGEVKTKVKVVDCVIQ